MRDGRRGSGRRPRRRRRGPLVSVSSDCVCGRRARAPRRVTWHPTTSLSQQVHLLRANPEGPSYYKQVLVPAHAIASTCSSVLTRSPVSRTRECSSSEAWSNSEVHFPMPWRSRFLNLKSCQAVLQAVSRPALATDTSQCPRRARARMSLLD